MANVLILQSWSACNENGLVLLLFNLRVYLADITKNKGYFIVFVKLFSIFSEIFSSTLVICCYHAVVEVDVLKMSTVAAISLGKLQNIVRHCIISI